MICYESSCRTGQPLPLHRTSVSIVSSLASGSSFGAKPARQELAIYAELDIRLRFHDQQCPATIASAQARPTCSSRAVLTWYGAKPAQLVCRQTRLSVQAGRVPVGEKWWERSSVANMREVSGVQQFVDELVSCMSFAKAADIGRCQCLEFICYCANLCRPLLRIGL